MGVRELTQHRITPIVWIVVLAVGAAYTFTFVPNSFATAKLHIVLDNPQVRRLLAEHGTLDKAGDTLQKMAMQPSLTLPNGAYLWKSEKSSAKCFLDGSTTVFQKVRITGWTHHGKEGWTCGPVAPFVDVP